MKILSFDSKKQCKATAQSILHETVARYNHSLKESDLFLPIGSEDYKIIRSILDLSGTVDHLQGIDVPIKADQAPYPAGADNYCFYYDDNGNYIKLSCPKILDGDTPEKKRKHSINKAFRWSIDPQRDAYFFSVIDKPENAHFKKMWQNNPQSVHVDHKDIPFCKILESFLKSEGIDILDVELKYWSEKVDSKFKVLADSAFETRWQDYHAERVVWQLLTASDNCRKGNRAD